MKRGTQIADLVLGNAGIDIYRPVFYFIFSAKHNHKQNNALSPIKSSQIVTFGNRKK
jgi:hypothetical protein